MLLKFNQCQKFCKTLCLICADFESLIQKNLCENILEKSSTRKVGEHVPCSYSISTTWTFDGVENNHEKVLCILKRACNENT